MKISSKGLESNENRLIMDEIIIILILGTKDRLIVGPTLLYMVYGGCLEESKSKSNLPKLSFRCPVPKIGLVPFWVISPTSATAFNLYFLIFLELMNGPLVSRNKAPFFIEFGIFYGPCQYLNSLIKFSFYIPYNNIVALFSRCSRSGHLSV